MGAATKFKAGDRVLYQGRHAGIVKYASRFLPDYGVTLDKDGGGRVNAREAELEAEAKPAAGQETKKDNEQFFRACAKAFSKVTKSRKYFTADDIWKMIDPAHAGTAQAMGSFMNEASKTGRIKATKRFKRSRRTSGPLKVWQSLVYAS